MDTSFSLQDIVDDLDVPRARPEGGRRIVVAGEFEAGKSSVINALLRQNVLPCNPGLASRPLIKIKNEAARHISAEDRVGRLHTPHSIADLERIENLATCDIRLPIPNLKDIEVVEVPFHHNGGISAADIAMMAEADLIIWVTIASQAWRLSEMAIVKTLPPGTREKSVLAISRADKLRNKHDVDKIEARLQSEACDYFSEIVFMQASTNNLDAAIADTRTWQQTGGAALASIANETMAARR